VEAALNYSYANIALEHSDERIDSLTYTLALNNGVASEADAAAAYNALGALVAPLNDEGISHVVIVDVTSQNTGDELILTAAVVVGSGYEKSINANYGSNDWWMWMGNGNCNCKNPSLNPPPSGNNLCADKRIQARMTQAINNGQYVYMVSVETWTVSDWSTNVVLKEIDFRDYPLASNPYGYRTYGCSGPSCTTCLTPDHMTKFTLGTWDVMGLIRDQYCPTKLSQGATVAGDFTTCTGNCTVYFHRITYRYGVIPRS
jgi:hypothetical protein